MLEHLEDFVVAFARHNMKPPVEIIFPKETYDRIAQDAIAGMDDPPKELPDTMKFNFCCGVVVLRKKLESSP